MPKSHLYTPMTTASTSNAPIDVTHQRRRYFESKSRDEKSKFLTENSPTPANQPIVNVHQRSSPSRWQWRTSRLIDGGGGNRLLTTGLTILFLLLGLLILIWINRTSNGNEIELLREFQQKTPSEFRSVYSDVNSDDGQIWLINLHEIRRRRHLNPTGPKDRTGQRIHGLARDCGLRCAFKLRHNDVDGRFFDVHLRRRRFNRMSSDTHEFVTPFVQYMDSENQTRAQLSRISVDCLYEAQVNGTEESGIVNLCDPNGGLFGTLALTDGAFVIEPLIDITDSTVNDLNSTNSRRFKRSSLQLKPHLIYRARSQTFDSPLSSSHSSSTSDSNSQEDFDSDEETDSYFGERKRRSANSWDHFVEVMVVADLKMLQYHKNDLENYILTLFSTVASIYRHASLGASVNIIVVRIVVLRYDNGNPRISEQAQDTLQQFCAWQQNMNDRNEAAAAHHDVAILLTRKDICRTKNKCDTLGLAELGTMCDAKKSCAIIEDNGLSAAFTIAHELGHIFNIPHDDERRCAQYMPLNKNSYHIMAPTLEYNTNPWAWSPCSSAMLEKFLDSHRSQTQCIYDKPVERRYFDKMFNFPLAGELYEINQQCRYVFGDTAEICPYMPTCRRLWCSTYSGFQMGCRTQHMPWADGTRCGHNQWCHQGSCIGLAPKDLKKINGEWGRWQEYGACSRTCGGGVKKGVRDCDSPRPVNGGKYCIGQRERYESCNTQECPVEARGFREVQCAEFNNKDVGIHGIPKSITWVPKYTGIASSERCRLYCRAHDSAAFYLLRDKVLDGTPCARNVDDICIDGTCHPAGCDHRLNSNMKRDACGVCGGHGQTCKTIEGNYNERGSFGYNEVLRIPAGSANIDISQKSHNNDKDDDNYLALRTAEGNFILNGDFQVSVFRQQIPIPGTVLEYSGSDYTVERINGSGPIQDDIYIHVLSVGNLNPPDVSYKYMIPKAPENRRTPSHAYPIQAKYYWTYAEEWSRCSSKCQGTQTQQLVCMDPLSTKPVNDQYCVNKRPAVNKRMCNVECSFKWKSTVVSGCTAHCGSGEQQQQSICVRSFQNNKPDEPAADRECEALGLRRPPTRIQCYTDCNGRKWTYSEWSTCSTTCGSSGMKRRQSFCVDGANRRLDSRYCERIPHESIEMECNRLPCPSWVYGQWSECSRSCDGGMRRRHAVCKDATGAELSAESCPAADRLDQEECNDHQCTKWRFGSWSQCSQTCGVGFESRDARCIVASTGAELPDDRCDVREKLLRKSCQKRSCPEWKVGSWSSCSVTCGNGYRERSVQCVEENVGRDGAARPISEARCIQPRPSSHELCTGAACPFWRLGQWSHCSVTCGSGSRRRTVDCVQPDGQLVDASLCTGVGTSQQTSPSTTESCRLIACPQWKPSAWSQCSKSCGDDGKQTRTLQCIRGDTEVVSDVECRLHHKPKTERQCDLAPCDFSNQYQHVQMYPRLQGPEYFWATGDWSQCSKSCNGGVQKRLVQCYGHQRVLPDAYCRNVEVEPSERSCNTQPCVHWVTGDWTPCSSSCGVRATQRRLVSCVADNPTASGASNVSTADCDPTTQPQARRSCNLPACPREPRLRYGEWKNGEWSTCSVSCGVGYRRRTVFCTTPICNDAQKPTQYEHCNLGKCGQKNNWQVGPWSHCSVSCGSDGFQMRKIWCQADFHQMKQLDDAECDRTEKPIARRGCARAACLSTSTQSTTTTRSFPLQKYSWISTNWSTCSSSCGQGHRHRDVFCVDTLTKQVRVDSSLCDSGTKPMTDHKCRIRNCPRWYREPWSTCSTTCGPGVRKREVYCKRNRRERLPDHMCLLRHRPEDAKPCELKRCPTYRWRVGPWTRCSDPCKTGEQFRRVYCMSDDRKRAASRMCSDDRMPLEKRPCPLVDCPYHWVPGPWSTCSQTCGIGFHFRRIECKIKAKKQPKLFADGKRVTMKSPEPTVLSRMCISLDKPVVSESCTLNPCNATYTWSVGQWTQCSVSCGSGVRKRRVKCVKTGTELRVDRLKCEQRYRPARREFCSLRNCLPSNCAELKTQNANTKIADGNYTVLVSGYRVEVYCHRMNETLPKTYLNVPVETNFAEFYDKRQVQHLILLYPHSCPYNGQRNDSCECSNDGHTSAGRSEFSKLRVDLHNMKINPHDYTFAKTLHGTPIAVGTAGDCYAMSDCPQGQFSIDLRNTGLRLADDLEWKTQGHRTTSKIERKFSNTLIQGQCGGYCGECMPDKFKGLVLEIDHKQKPAVGAG
ncbi:BMA-GON-1, isoform e [Aphelenchoides besseyi]|nr:BMA-GON-1, isoform e [Aphelenchoides besseyi]